MSPQLGGDTDIATITMNEDSVVGIATMDRVKIQTGMHRGNDMLEDNPFEGVRRLEKKEIKVLSTFVFAHQAGGHLRGQAH